MIAFYDTEINMKKYISVILAVGLIATSFTACGGYKENEKEPIEKVDNGYTVSYVSQDEDIDLHTRRMETYLDGSPNKIGDFAKGDLPFDKDNTITYTADTDFTLYISKNKDSSNSIVIPSVDRTVVVDNLEIGTTYYVYALAGEELTELSPIVTEDCAPRVINVDGVKNVRDVGGWETENGRVKQGMLYRCGRLNESDTDKVNIEITQEGKATMLNRLGIKTEIDLRVVDNNETGGITDSPLGGTVNYMSFPMSYAHDFYLDSKPLVRDVFKVLADESNYPIIFHCNIGTDRTGMIAYMVNGLLGVDEEDLFYDYCFSNFADIGGRRTIKGLKRHSYYKEIQKQKGDTLSEKIHNLLLELGVTEAEIQSIISIMSE